MASKNDIIWLSSRYRNYHSACFNSLVPDFFTNDFSTGGRMNFSQENTDYHTNTYYGVYGRIHLTDNFSGYDPIGLTGFYETYIRTTDMLAAIPRIGDSGYLFRVINDDGSGCFAKLTVTDIVYTGQNLNILQYLVLRLDRGYFTNYLDTSTEVIYGQTPINMGSNQFWQADARLYLGQGFAMVPVPNSEKKYPIFFYAAMCVSPNDLDNPPFLPECPINLPEMYYQESYPITGIYGSAQDGTSQGDAFETVTYSNVHGNGISIFNDSKLCRDRNTNITAVEYSPEAGEESTSGGMDDPSFDDSSDTIAIPDDPGIGVASVGFVNVYKTGSQSLQNMGVELFPPLQYTAPTAITATDTMEAVVNGFNSLVTFLANVPSFFDQIMANTLINYVIDCHIIPVTPTGGTTENIKVGYKTLQCTGTRLTNDYVNFSCGSISVREYYANFADFLTTAKLYLPFVGFVSTRPEWFQNDTLRVDYKFNVVDGSFTCYVRSGGKYVNNGNSNGTIVAQYGGNACIHLPITGVTYSNMVSGLVGAGTGAVAGAASGNIGATATSAISAASVHGDISQSNSYNGSAAFLGCRYPFLMIERPVSSYSKNYQHEIGIPANIYAKLSQLSGFVKMENVHVDGITGATDEEKEEIRRLLASGVIV